MDIRVIFLACLCLVVRVKGAAYGEVCNTSADCPGANQECAASKVCACVANYKWDTAATGGAACKVSAGQTSVTCAADTDCIGVSTCSATHCVCVPGYKVMDGMCVDTYDTTCTADANCNTLDHSKCKGATGSMKCLCADGYKVNAATPKGCDAIIGATCTSVTDCNGVSNVECTGTANSKTCACMNGYEGGTCTQIYDTKACPNGDADCSALKYGKCSAGKCKCGTNAVLEDNVCKLKIDQACPNDGDLCPMHSTCKGNPKKCACDDNYETSEDKCKLTNSGMTVKVSVLLMVAALFSVFLH